MGTRSVMFGLVASFPLGDPAVDRAREAVEARRAVRVREVDAPIDVVVTDVAGGFTRLTVSVTGIDPPVWPQDWDSEATACDLRGAAGQLYDLLRSLDGYLLARVGWDVEASVDPAPVGEQLRRDGLWQLEGLVVADTLAAEWGIATLLEPLAPGYHWHPYEP